MAIEGSSSPIVGRFVFAPDLQGGLRMVALAEGAAIVSERARLSVAWVYVFARWNEKLGR